MESGTAETATILPRLPQLSGGTTVRGTGGPDRTHLKLPVRVAAEVFARPSGNLQQCTGKRPSRQITNLIGKLLVDQAQRLIAASHQATSATRMDRYW